MKGRTNFLEVTSVMCHNGEGSQHEESIVKQQSILSQLLKDKIKDIMPCWQAVCNVDAVS
jgi:hypothetical protein